MIRRHLTDAQLIEASVGHAGHDDEALQCLEHVEHCGECRGRHDALRALFADTSSAAVCEAEAAFPADRLARQHDQIMERVEQASRAGRVISFPSAFGRVMPPSAASPSRWVAAAAAAGLVVGLLGGRLTHDLQVQSGTSLRRAPVSAARAVILPVAQPAEDDLLGQVEVAFESSGPSALRPLDALTPVAWDVRD